MTLKKIAELAGCSVATVSKAFSGSREIGKETCERIFDVAKELGCFEKYYKGPNSRPLIALLFPETESEFYGMQIGLLEQEISKRGADTVVALTRFDPARTERLFSMLVHRYKADGVILSGHPEIKNTEQVPLVSFGGAFPPDKEANADALTVDYRGGIFKLVETIKEFEHRKVGFIGEEKTEVKKIWLHEALRRYGLPVYEELAYKAKGRFAEAGEEGFMALYKRGDLPDVIVAGYDQIAFGAIKCAKKLGLKVPEDISIVGIDDITATDFIDVPLTSLHIHIEDVCKAIVELLFKKINNRYYRERSDIVIPVSVNLRASLLDKRTMKNNQ